jgi:hypothetical protein
VVLVLQPHGSAAPAVLAALLLYRVALHAAAARGRIAGWEVVGAPRRGKPLEALLERL